MREAPAWSRARESTSAWASEHILGPAPAVDGDQPPGRSSAATDSRQYGCSWSSIPRRASAMSSPSRATSGSQAAAWRRLMSQRRVTLLHGPGVANPQIGEAMFHVEHRPVHPPSPTKATFLNELVNARVDDLDRKSL